MVTSNSSTVAAGSPFDRNRLREDKRSEIIRIAGEVFCSTGYAQTSVEDIAKRIGISKAIIYYYFENKIDLFRACHLVATESLERAFEASRDDDSLLHLRRFVRLYVLSLIGSDSPGAVLLDFHLLPEREASEIHVRRERVHKDLEKLIAQLMRRGLVRALNRRLAVITMMSAINVVPRWYREGGRWSPEQVAEHCVAQLVDGLLVSNAS
ncbi:MAG: TetR/AcrR family transcriptional regulator [Burkholderiaceae bacterium]|nr:TetR/AcrR family transcriptional regulator [Burkholderiaceae bacterium]